VLNCTDHYVTSKRGKENHVYASGTCEQDNGNQITRFGNAESALEDASNDSMSIDCDITDIAKDINVISPVSRLDDSSFNMSDIIENIPNYEQGYSNTLEDTRTEVQKAADMNNCNTDSTQLTSDATGPLTPYAAHEDGPFVVCPRTKEIYNIDALINEHKTVSPISSLDDSCFKMSDIIENTPNFELDYSFILEDVGTDIQKAFDINDLSEDITQFITDATRS
jgi:hypothetical protein